MNNLFLFSIDSTAKAFSVIDAGTTVNYELIFANAAIPTIAVGDELIGFVSQERNEFQSCYRINAINGNTLQLVKIIERLKGVPVAPYLAKIADAINALLSGADIVVADHDVAVEIRNAVIKGSDAELMPVHTKHVEELVLKAFLELFKNTIVSTGLKYSDSMLRRFVAALIAKPFVILTGLSGSGKTKLAEAFVRWICEKDPKRWRIVPIGADWTDSQKLLGFPNALDDKRYILPDTQVLQMLIDADKDPDNPYFLILDEMNLSVVERYFADFLSTMESSSAQFNLYDGDKRVADSKEEMEIPPSLKFPKNLFVIGTMNVDETTHMFSPKVLDRAQVIEFRVTEKDMNAYLAGDSVVDLDKLHDPNGNGKGCQYAKAFLNHAKSEFTQNEAAKTALKTFFPKLADISTEFGFRTASECIRFASIYVTAGGTENEAIDLAIMHKLLPKVHGSRRRLAKPLEALWSLCLNEGGTETLSDFFKGTADIKTICKYPISAEKITRLYNAAETNGFASYAEA